MPGLLGLRGLHIWDGRQEASRSPPSCDRPPRWPSLPGGARSLLPQLSEGTKLLNVVEAWLRKEKEARQARDDERRAAGGGREAEAPVAPTRTPFDMPSKHLAFFR